MKKKEYRYFVAYTFKSDRSCGNGHADITYGKIRSSQDINTIEKTIKQLMVDKGIVSDDVNVVTTNWKRYDR